uniref:Cystatin domain-containing protein n=1 Tax=Panagrolaimus sp. PS1159 TaxID=55785 RepID=A0AC35FKN1_9BILA
MISFEAAKIIHEADESQKMKRAMKRRRQASEGDILQRGAALLLNTRSKEVKEIAKKAMMEYNEKCPDNHYFFPIVVIRATKQFMNGIIYKLDILAGMSPKLKREVSTKYFYSKSHHAEVNELERRLINATVYQKESNGHEQIIIAPMPQK